MTFKNRTIFVCIAVLGLIASSFAQEPLCAVQANVLTATGTGTVEVQTNLTSVVLGVQVQAQTAVAAQTQAATITQAIINALSQFNVQNLRTETISLSPVFNSSAEGQQIIGFRAISTLAFDINSAQAGAAIDAAIGAGANTINSVSFFADEATLEAARQQALVLAVNNAIERATVVANRLDRCLASTSVISIGSTETPMFKAEIATASSATPVLPGQVTVASSVTINFTHAANCSTPVV